MKVFKYLNLLTLFYGIVVCIVGLYKHISFGWGLGDLFLYPILYVWTFIHLIITLANKPRNANTIITTSIFATIFWLFFSLKATVWRGVEYRWNGKIFYGYYHERQR